MRKPIWLICISVCLGVLSNCNKEEQFEIGPGSFHFDYYTPRELEFSSKGGVDSIWTEKAIFVVRDDTTVIYGNSGKKLQRDTLPGNIIRWYWKWYEIETPYKDSGYLRVYVHPNDSNGERHDELYVRIKEIDNKAYKRFTIRQKEK
ncbi:MAG: hypothetical protein J5506_01445 [Prevotella sp.]|nr:hypothetical protein [Prevotella sp.]